MFHVSFQKARSCCFHLADAGEPCSEQRYCACKWSHVCLDTGGWDIVCIKYRLPKQSNVFLFTQIILQQLQNRKMGITQEQIMQVRFLFCENHNSRELCKCLFSFAKLRCPCLLGWFSWFTLKKKPTVSALLFLLLETLFLLNKWASSIFVDVEISWP